MPIESLSMKEAFVNLAAPGASLAAPANLPVIDQQERNAV
jgi:hypothetical protein